MIETSMPSVAMINTVCSGSHGRIMLDISRAAKAEGFETLTVFGRGQALAQDAIRVGKSRDILCHAALTRLLDRHGLGSRSATRRLVQRLEEARPALVHLHNLHGYYLHAPELFAYLARSGVPVIWTLHDCWAFTGHCSHFVRANCSRWQTGCHDCPLKKAYPASLGLDASRKNWEWKREIFSSLENLTIVSPSRWLDGCLEKSFLQNQDRRVIENGVDLSLFMPSSNAALRKKMGIGPEKKLLLAVASPFDERKGFADALEVARRTRGKAVVALVGLNEKQMRGLPENVIGMKRTEGPEALVALYGEADCLLNPTYEDTYPTVNLEAVACGTPVAAYGVGGCTEQLKGAHGKTVPVGDARALAEAALELAAQKEALTKPCRAWAEQYFDRRNCVNAYQALYREKLGRERRQGR